MCNGMFGTEFDSEDLNIYLVRSDAAIAVDPAGKVKSVAKIQNTSENNSYWNHSVFSDRRAIRDTEYVLDNDLGVFNLFASSYTQLKVTNNGETNVFYDVNSAQFSNMVIAAVGVFVFVCLVVLVIARQFVGSKHDA